MEKFWQTKTLAEMTPDEWEALCDGCGKCCLVKLEDAESGEVSYTDVACRYLDLHTCQCKQYTTRLKLVENCVSLTPQRINDATWLPSTCAYRLLAQGKSLPVWHRLIKGDNEAMVRAGESVSGRRVISEEYVHEDDMVDHIVKWVN